MAALNTNRFFWTVICGLSVASVCCASGLGRCPKFEYMKDFNVSRFTGQWYEIERSFYLMQITSKCTILHLRETPKGHVNVTISSIGRWSGRTTMREGIAYPSRRDDSMFLFRVNSQLPHSLARYLPGAGLYQILNTDYDNYAILWTCSNYAVLHIDRVWLLGRRTEIDASMRVDIYRFLNDKRIDPERLIIPKNNNCTVEYD